MAWKTDGLSCRAPSTAAGRTRKWRKEFGLHDAMLVGAEVRPSDLTGRIQLRLRVGVVVGDVRPRVGAGHAKINQQLRDRFGSHRRPAVGVDGELAPVDALGGDGVGDELLGKLGVLRGGDHPGDHVTRVDVDVDFPPWAGHGGKSKIS